MPVFLIDLGGINCNIGTLVADDDAAGHWFGSITHNKHLNTFWQKRPMMYTQFDFYPTRITLDRLHSKHLDAPRTRPPRSKLRQNWLKNLHNCKNRPVIPIPIATSWKAPGNWTNTSRKRPEFYSLPQRWPNTHVSWNSIRAIRIPPNAGQQAQYAGHSVEKQQRPRRRRKQYDTALTLLTKLVDDSSEEFPDCVTLLDGVCCNLGLLDIDDDPAEALKWFDRAQEAIERTIAKTPANQTAKTFLRNTHNGRASALEKLGRKDNAAEYRQKAAQINAEIKQAAIDAQADTK